MRRIQRRDQENNHIPTTEDEHGAVHDISVAYTRRNRPDFEGPRSDVPDEASEEEDDTPNMPTLNTNTPRQTRKSPRIAGKEPQYSGLYCSVEGRENVLEVEEVSNIVHRDNCFLFTVDTGPSSTTSSSSTRYLDRKLFVSESGLIGDMHPYAFSAKVQTHTSDNPTYKDIVRLPDEERKLWDAAMIK